VRSLSFRLADGSAYCGTYVGVQKRQRTCGCACQPPSERSVFTNAPSQYDEPMIPHSCRTVVQSANHIISIANGFLVTQALLSPWKYIWGRMGASCMQERVCHDGKSGSIAPFSSRCIGGISGCGSDSTPLIDAFSMF
jgi:hypothetical protein